LPPKNVLILLILITFANSFYELMYSSKFILSSISS